MQPHADTPLAMLRDAVSSFFELQPECPVTSDIPLLALLGFAVELRAFDIGDCGARTHSVNVEQES